jgi:alkylhydroperoxidase family enzyme
MAGMEDETLRALRKGRDLTDPHLEALRRFTTVVQESRGEPSRDEIKAFLAQGFTRAQVLEVLVGVAMKTLSNYTNHLANTPLDEAFADFRWDEE